MKVSLMTTSTRYKKMNSQYITKIFRWAGAAAALGLLTALTLQTTFAEVPSSKGAATLLMKPQTIAPVKTVQKAMSCTRCVDHYATRVDSTARGVIKPTLTYVQHQCRSCDTTLATVGHGKTARTVATHKCDAASQKSLSCCN